MSLALHNIDPVTGLSEQRRSLDDECLILGNRIPKIADAYTSGSCRGSSISNRTLKILGRIPNRADSQCACVKLALHTNEEDDR